MKRNPPNSDHIPPDELRKRLDFSDQELLAECDVDLYKASGPGGQHRNKVTSAVRLHHRPSGVLVIGTESRSQHENKARALRRLREALALTFRAPLSAAPCWPETVHIRDRRLHVNPKNPAYFHVVALVLDALAAKDGRLRAAADWLGLSSSTIVRFLQENRAALTEANRIRRHGGFGPLKSK
ncbi:MAG: peptide chain release factor-like protein [Planctomycetota bacterium]|nr:MAG: peptide chain release factor-like protein [Planctomycetota bacterium]